MSLRAQPLGSIPEQTACVASAAFPKGNPYLMLRDHLGTIFQDDDFATLFPAWGYPGLHPGRVHASALHWPPHHAGGMRAGHRSHQGKDWGGARAAGRGRVGPPEAECEGPSICAPTRPVLGTGDQF